MSEKMEPYVDQWAVCPKCGYEWILEISLEYPHEDNWMMKFCPNCGQELEYGEQWTDENGRYCNVSPDDDAHPKHRLFAASAWRTDEPPRDGTWVLAHNTTRNSYVAIQWFHSIPNICGGMWIDQNANAYDIIRFDAFAAINPYEVPT